MIEFVFMLLAQASDAWEIAGEMRRAQRVTVICITRENGNRRYVIDLVRPSDGECATADVALKFGE